MLKSAYQIIFTRSVRNWLKQFELEDLPGAKFLLRNLHFVSPTAFERGIKKRIRHVAASTGPVALFAVRDLADGERYFPAETSIGILRGGFWMMTMNLANLLATWILSKRFFRRTILRVAAHKIRKFASGLSKRASCVRILKELRPSRTKPNAEVGSEGRVANLIRNICMAHPENFLDHPSKSEMRVHRCSRIVLVDDMLSTAGRLMRFMSNLKQENWLWSWRSLRWIQIHIVVYCASTDGERALRRKFRYYFDGVHFEAIPRWGVRWWTAEQRRQIEKLCKKYAKKAGISGFTIGRREGLGTILFEAGCTSISPPILWEKTSTWEPLFPNRKLPDDIIQELSSNEKRREALVVANEELGVQNPATSLPFANFLVATQAELQVLQAASKHYRQPLPAATWSGLEYGTYCAARARCQELKLLDGQGNLTELGRQELKRLRHKLAVGTVFVRHETDRLPTSQDSFYFPSRLRKAKGSSSGHTTSSGPTGVPDGSVAALANKNSTVGAALTPSNTSAALHPPSRPATQSR